MAEALLNHLGQGRVQAFSAGSRPTGAVHPKSLALLQSKGVPTEGLRSKSWDEFGDAAFDAVITVCDNAAGETCPVFLGTPVKAHWGVPDPAAATGTDAEIMQVFESSCATLEARIRALLDLPPDLRGADLAQKLRAIGETVT